MSAGLSNWSTSMSRSVPEELLRQQSYAIKNQLLSPTAPYCAHNRTFPCMKADYLYGIRLLMKLSTNESRASLEVDLDSTLNGL